MAADKDKGQRRVYVLPNDLVERIVEYQQDMGIGSEVEAARRLLDEALKRRDDWRKITSRFAERLKETRVLTDIAKDVLMGHPLVRGINFEADALKFGLITGETVTVRQNGEVSAEDENGRALKLDPRAKSGGGFSRDLDDEIPF